MEQSVATKALPLLHEKVRTIQNNLLSWTPLAWLIFFGIIPLLLAGIEFLSPEIKAEYFILDTTAPHLTAIFLSSYTHSDITHLSNNIGLYLIALVMIFSCCTNPKILHRLSLVVLLIVPLFTSFLTIHISAILGQGLYSQGFSAVAYAYSAIGLYAFFCWVMPDIHSMPPSHTPSHPSQKTDIIGSFLIMLAIVLVLSYGLSAGGLTTSSGNLVNGPAHVIGFFTGIISASLVDLKLRDDNMRINHLFILCGITMLIPYLLALK